MNSATHNLESDHVSILELIDVMEIMATAPSPSVSDLEEAVDLIRNFADGLHHAKEESLLFPLMAQRGFSLQQGPIAVMLSEHTQGRNYVKGMSENIAFYKNGNQNSLAAIYDNIHGYCELLKNHISKENNILFRMADNVLTGDDQSSLMKQFEAIETQVSTHQKADFIDRIEKLTKTYITH
jgi:hemerythrin-like domain-containing protein